MHGVITVNSAEAYVGTCLTELGLIQAPRAGVAPLLDDGSLTEVLPQLASEPMPVTLLCPQRRNLPRAACAPSWIGLPNCWRRRWFHSDDARALTCD